MFIQFWAHHRYVVSWSLFTLLICYIIIYNMIHRERHLSLIQRWHTIRRRHLRSIFGWIVQLKCWNHRWQTIFYGIVNRDDEQLELIQTLCYVGDVMFNMKAIDRIAVPIANGCSWTTQMFQTKPRVSQSDLFDLFAKHSDYIRFVTSIRAIWMNKWLVQHFNHHFHQLIHQTVFIRPSKLICSTLYS